MDKNRPEKQLARLFIALDGPVFPFPIQSKTEEDQWAVNIFPSLCAISRSGIYEIVLLDTLSPLSEDWSMRVELIGRVLSHQGIAVSQIVEPTSQELDRLLGTTRLEHSFVIAQESVSAGYADSMGVNPLVFTDWKEIEQVLLKSDGEVSRRASIQRDTKETKISLQLNIDGSGDSHISTGLPFFDHMLQQISKHARFDISLYCEGDLEVDEHHTVEDIAIVLGQTIGKALGDKRGINRYGFEILPMDECLAEVALDFSGRPWFVWHVEFTRDVVGTFPTELFAHFFKSFSDEAKCNLHMTVNSGNVHHQAEALFKAFARALRSAVFRYPGNHDLPSTKGVL
jgi:imidazoleglycerol-phosphate dehydratase/histidinol-phosphatase